MLIKFVGVSSKLLQVFLKSSAIFGNLRTSSEIHVKCSGAFVLPSEQFWNFFWNLRKVVGNPTGNHQKCRHQHVYIIKRTLHGGLKIIILFLVAKTIFYERAQRVSKILFCNSKIKFISSRPRVISSIYFTYESRDTLANVPRIITHVHNYCSPH